MQTTEIIIIIAVIILVGSLSIKFTKKPKEKRYEPIIKETAPSVELELLRLINEYRISQGLNTLQLEVYVSDLAYDHVSYMIEDKKVSHDYFTKRFEASGAENAGEIVATGYLAAKSILAAYLDSPGHKEVLDDARFNWIGISVFKLYNCCILVEY